MFVMGTAARILSLRTEKLSALFNTDLMMDDGATIKQPCDDGTLVSYD